MHITFIYRYILVKDVIDGPQNILQVNYTPQFFNDAMELRHTWLTLTVILGIIFFIMLCLFLALRQRINIAIQMIEHGSKAVAQMCSSLFFPIVPLVFQTIVIVWFVFTAMYMSSIVERQYNIYYDQDQTSIKRSINIIPL